MPKPKITRTAAPYVAPIQVFPAGVYSIKDACAFLRCSRAHFYTIAERYDLPVKKDGDDKQGRVKIKGAALLAVAKAMVA